MKNAEDADVFRDFFRHEIRPIVSYPIMLSKLYYNDQTVLNGLSELEFHCNCLEGMSNFGRELSETGNMNQIDRLNERFASYLLSQDLRNILENRSWAYRNRLRQAQFV